MEQITWNSCTKNDRNPCQAFRLCPFKYQRSEIPGNVSKRYFSSDIGTNITDKSLTALKHMPNIEYLNVSKCHALSDAGLMHVRQYLPQLKVLSISYCKRLTAVAITATWEGCQRIDTLYASHLPGLTDKVLHVIANTKRRGDMVKYIDVSHCRSITTAGILSIADSPNGKLRDSSSCLLAFDSS